MAASPKPKPLPNVPDSKKLRVIKKIQALLEGIQPGNNFRDADNTELPYPIDMRNKVFRGRLTVTTDEAEYAMSILENPRPPEGSHVGGSKLERVADWILLLQGWPRDDIKNPSDPAYAMAALAEQRLSLITQLDSRGNPLYPDSHMLGVDSEGDPELVEFVIGESVVRPPTDANTRLAMFYIPLTVRIATNPSRPFR